MDIKVRAWDGKRMLYKGLHDHAWYTESKGGKHVCEHDQSHERRFKTMLYTGRKDRDGKEIYDGDIDIDGSVVVFDKHSCVFRIGRHWLHSASSTLIQIVGNIHTNPELVKS